MLTNSNSYITEVLEASTDALNNLYVVTFRGNFLDEVATDLQVRCDSFTPPSIAHSSYQVRYLTSWVDRPTAKVNVTRSFTLSFRVDSNYDVFKAILSQQGVTFNPSKSFTATAIDTLKNNSQLFDVTVDVVSEGVQDEEISTMTIFKFEDCWISSVTPIAYTYDNSSPTTVSMTINFLKMSDLQSGITGETSSPNVSLGPGTSV